MDELEANGEPQNTVEVAAEEGGTVVVTIGGELDLSTIPAVEERIAAVLESAPRRLVIDLGTLRFADSSAIALWVRCAMKIDQFELRDPPQFLRRVIATMGLSERLGVSG